MTLRAFVALASVLGVSTVARADRTITVNGNNSDWVGVTTCFAESTTDGSQGIELSRVCLENDNASANTGYLYALYESPQNLPTNQGSYFGFVLDLNNDGLITTADEAYAAYYPGAGTAPSQLQVLDPTNYSLRRTYSSTSNCGGVTGANGWSGARNGKVMELRVAYGCLGLSFNNDDRLMQLGVYPAFDVTSYAYYDGTSGGLTPAVVPADVTGLVAISGPARNRLVWSNPSQHEGVLILRATGGAPTTAPVKGTTYAVNQTLGNARVVYVDSNGSTVSTFTDTGLTNGTRYYYRVFNHHQRHTYSTGNAPTSSGVFSEPTSRTSPAPLWCYSMGLPSLLTPVTESGGGVMTANNLGQVTANLASTDPSVDGNERWRPVQLSGAVQSRAPLVPLVDRTGNYLLTGDQSGKTYLIESATGTVVWTGNGGAAIGTAIQAQAATQLFNYANATFQAAHSPPATAAKRDLIFFATRNGSATNNRVVALSSVDGSIVWAYQPNDLDIVSGGMMVDYANNRLYVAARSNGNRQASLRILNSVNGAELKRLSLGDIDQSVARDNTLGQAYVVNNNGTAYGISLSTMTQVWSQSIGATSSYLWPMDGGFVAPLKANSVRRYSVNGTTVSQVWSRTIASPTGVRYHTALQKFFVGSSDGKIHQLNPTTGVDEKQLVVSTQTIGAPHIDAALNRLHVGTLDGRLCSFQLPIP